MKCDTHQWSELKLVKERLLLNSPIFRAELSATIFSIKRSVRFAAISVGVDSLVYRNDSFPEIID